jgi:hypothetical protein
LIVRAESIALVNSGRTLIRVLIFSEKLTAGLVKGVKLALKSC